MNKVSKLSLARFLRYVWPALFCLITSGAILGGFVIRPESVASEASQGKTKTAQTSQTLKAPGVFDSKKPWTYNFEAERSPTLNPAIWTAESGVTAAMYNQELQTYTDRAENVRIEGGALTLEARAEQRDGRSYTSARINTKDSFNFTYGTLEVDMKLPRGVGTWPAAWLMPSRERYRQADFPNATDANRSWALNGEIDFMEAVGYLPNQIIPATHAYNTLESAAVYTPGFVDDPYDTYHRYGVIKTPSSITFTIDGKPYATRNKTSDDPLDWPFDQPYYLILDLAIGGKWAGDHGIDQTMAPWQLSIRSIAYQPM